MPTVTVPGVGDVDFPESMSHEQITHAIETDLLPKGLLQAGNIDLHHRPVVKNADGTISTVRSMSIEVGGHEILIPTVSDAGRVMTDTEAIAEYRRTGKHLGIFDGADSATAYAQRLHQDQAAEYGQKGAGEAARSRLRTRGTSPEQVKARAAAGKSVSPEDPTTYERLAADASALIAGTGDLMGGVVAGIPEQLYNINSAPGRVGKAAIDVLRKGGTAGEALRAARDVQPHRELESLAGAASDDAERVIRGALGVRPGAIVPQEDLMRQVPGLLALLDGGGKLSTKGEAAATLPKVTEELPPPAVAPIEAPGPATVPDTAPPVAEMVVSPPVAAESTASRPSSVMSPEEFHASGEELLHGTSRRFDRFSDEAKSNNWPRLGGAFFTRDPQIAENFARGGGRREVVAADAVNAAIESNRPLGSLLEIAPELEDEGLTLASLRKIASKRIEEGRTVHHMKSSGEWVPLEDPSGLAPDDVDSGIMVYPKGKHPRVIRTTVYGGSIDLTKAKTFPQDLADQLKASGNGYDQRVYASYARAKGTARGSLDADYVAFANSPGLRDYALSRDIGKIEMPDDYDSGFRSAFVPSERYIAEGKADPYAEYLDHKARSGEVVPPATEPVAAAEVAPPEQAPKPPTEPPAEPPRAPDPPAEEPPEEPPTADDEPVPHPWLPAVDSSEFGAALRTLHTGERDVRIAEANNLADDIRKLLPNHRDLEALTILRDFRARPADLAGYLDGTASVIADRPDGPKAVANAGFAPLRPVIERAMNPTPEMLAADAKLTDYFGRTLQEGRDLGFLDSSVAPEDYINHLLLPKDAEKAAKSGGGRAGVNRFTTSAKKRYYPTVLDAIADGVKPRSLNAADAVSIYGDKHGTAAATHLLINTMKESDLAMWGTESTKPRGWAEVGPGTRLFRNEVPVTDSAGNPQVMHQALYAPKKIADALRPLTDQDFTHTVPGFRATGLYQQYIKSVELGLSVFHVRALNLTALGNEGLTGLVKSYQADMSSAVFRDVESTFLKHGGTTSITGRTFEAYRAARPTSLPTKLDVVRNLPVFKQFDQISAATSKITFDILQRKFKVTDFGIKDAKWIAEHPKATTGELAAARRAIAKEVNASYGGLNWEALGVNKATRSLTRAVFLAPDWTFSNYQNVKTAFTSGPGGAAARAFWARSAITGVALTQLTSLLLSGQKSPDSTQVYLGKDKNGLDILQNIYFAGAPSDLIGLVKNVQDYGAVIGTAHSIAAKLAPIMRTGVQLLTNRNYLGQEIAKKGGGIKGDLGAVEHIGTQLLPVPFSISNIVQMMQSKTDYTPTEYITTILAGTRPRHVRDGGKRSPKFVDDYYRYRPGDHVPAGDSIVSVVPPALRKAIPVADGYGKDPEKVRIFAPQDASPEAEEVRAYTNHEKGAPWVAVYDTKTNAIVANSKFAREWTRGVLIHEAGHALWENSLPPLVKEQWRQIHANLPDKKIMKEYRNDPEHTFVETFRDFVTAPAYMKKSDLHLYAWLKAVLGREYGPYHGDATQNELPTANVAMRPEVQ